jgi:hypothetical protein
MSPAPGRNRPSHLVRLACVALGGLAAPVGARAACPDDYTYTVIADSADEWTSFGRAPAITSGGRVAFVGELDSGGYGLYIGSGLSDPVPRMFDRTNDPLSDFVEFGDPAVNGAGQIAFWARMVRTVEPSDPEGIFRAELGLQPPTEMALDRDADPASIYLGLGRDPDLRLNGRVVFAAGLLGGTTQVIHEAPGPIELASSASDPYYGHQHVTVSAASSWFAHWAGNDVGAEGTVLRNGVPAGVSDATTGSFVGTNPVVSDGGAVAYREHYPAAQPGPTEVRVRRWSGAVPVPGGAIVVDTAVDPVHNLHLATLSSAGSGCVVFDAFHDVPVEGPKVFIGDADEFHPLFERGLEILDGVVADFAIGRHAANNRGQVALWVLLSLGLGNYRELIVRADPDGAGVSYYDDGFETGNFGRWSDVVGD